MYMQMLSLLKQMHIHTFDERSEPEKSQIFRVSALNASCETGRKAQIARACESMTERLSADNFA